MEQDWLRYHSTWRGIKGRAFYKSEIFDNFIPAARRAVEKNVIKGTAMLIPSPEFFEVYPGDELDPRAGDRAAGVRAYFSYLFAKRIRIKSLVSQLLRTYHLYGRAVAKTGVVVEVDSGGVPSVWPTTRAVDPFSFYIWPESVPTIDEAQIVFEDNFMPYSIWEQHQAEGRLSNVPPVRDMHEPEFPHHWGQRLNLTGLQTPDSTGGDTKARADESVTPPKFVGISEVWYREKGQWLMCWLLWSCTDGPRIVRRYKLQTGRHPYRMSVARQLPGEQYTTGMMDELEPLQVMYNDQHNMTMEGQATAFAPIAVIDPALIGRSAQFKYGPRQKWFTAPDGVRFLEAPDTTANGYKGLAATAALIESFSADTPMSNGMPSRGMPRAGFAVSSMMNLALADIKDAAQSIEDDILTPMMGDIHAFTQMFVPPEQLIKIPGTRDVIAQQMKSADLAGDFEFRWVGSLQSQDQQVRGQRLMTILQALGKVAQFAAPDLASHGKKINWEPLITRLWRDGAGERGADNLITDMTPQEIQQMQEAANKRPPPKVAISLKGELDPVVSRDLADDATVNNSGGPAVPLANPPGPDKKLPTTAEGATRQQSRAMAEPASP